MDTPWYQHTIYALLFFAAIHLLLISAERLTERRWPDRWNMFGRLAGIAILTIFFTVMKTHHLTILR